MDNRLYVVVGEVGPELPVRVHFSIAEHGSAPQVLREAIEDFGGDVKRIQHPGRVEDHLSDGHSVAKLAAILFQMDQIIDRSGQLRPWTEFMAALVQCGIKIGRERKGAP